MLSVESLFPTYLLMRKFHFGVLEWYFLVFTGKSVVNKQQIRLLLVNRALQKLTKINPFYNIIIGDQWEDLSEQSELVLWKLLTYKDNGESNNSDQTGSDDDIQGIDKVKERE